MTMTSALVPIGSVQSSQPLFPNRPTAKRWGRRGDRRLARSRRRNSDGYRVRCNTRNAAGADGPHHIAITSSVRHQIVNATGPWKRRGVDQSGVGVAGRTAIDAITDRGGVFGVRRSAGVPRKSHPVPSIRRRRGRNHGCAQKRAVRNRTNERAARSRLRFLQRVPALESLLQPLGRR
jgi:hypothetical protein